MDPAPVFETAAKMGQDGNLDHPHRTTEEGPRMKVKIIGIDLAKDVFGVHGVDAQGKALVHKRVTRRQLLDLLGKLERRENEIFVPRSAHSS